MHLSCSVLVFTFVFVYLYLKLNLYFEMIFNGRKSSDWVVAAHCHRPHTLESPASSSTLARTKLISTCCFLLVVFYLLFSTCCFLLVFVAFWVWYYSSLWPPRWNRRSWTRPCCSLYLYLCGCSVSNCRKLHVWHSNGQSWYNPLYSVSLFVSHQYPLSYWGVEVDYAQNSMFNIAMAKVSTTVLCYPLTFSCSCINFYHLWHLWQVADADQDWKNDNTRKTCHANSKG